MTDNEYEQLFERIRHAKQRQALQLFWERVVYALVTVSIGLLALWLWLF